MDDKGMITEYGAEILERVVRLETKIDSYNSLREKLDKTASRTDRNTEVLDALVESNKWVRRMAITAFVTTTCTIMGAVILAVINK